MSSTKPLPLTLRYAFYDKEHWHRNEIGSVSLTTKQFSEFRVCDLMDLIEQQHNQSDCVHICNGPLLVVSAWGVKIPLDTLSDGPPALEQASDGAIHLLKASSTIASALRPVCDEQPSEDEISIICDFTYTGGLPDVSLNTSKRPSEMVSRIFNKRPKRPDSNHESLLVCLIPPVTQSTKLNLPPPCSGFPSWAQSDGICFIDKSLYILALHRIMNKYKKCFVSQPASTGKTAFISLASTWYNCQSSPRIDDLFAKLLIVKATNPSDDLCRKEMLCLTVNIPDIGDASRIESGIIETVREFAITYKDELGISRHGPVFSSQERSLRTMLVNIFKRVKSLERQMFVALDNVDGPILFCMTHFKTRQPLNQVWKTLSLFLLIFNVPDFDGFRLLVMSRLPALPIPPSSLEDISHRSDLIGAFGMNKDEVKDLSAIFSRDSTRYLDLNRPGLEKALGRFLPTALNNQGPSHLSGEYYYNFTLTLSHITTTFELPNDHGNLSHSPLLIQISAIGKDLLSYLHRVGRVFISPVQDVTWLTEFDGNLETSENTIWLLLFYLGALKVMDLDFEGHHKEKVQWGLEVSSPFVAQQIFSQCQPAVFDETQAQLDLRELLDMRPAPLAATMTDLLLDKPLLDLREMSEAVLQAMFDTYLRNKKHYFPQLALLTDCTKPKNAKNVPPGQGRYGYSDFFVTGNPELRPRRDAAVELKCLHLMGFVRADHENARRNRSFDKDSIASAVLEAKAQLLTSISEADLDKQQYAYVDNETKKTVVTSVGAVRKEATLQLQSYVNAIQEGHAQDTGYTTKTHQKNGLSTAERRVRATNGTDFIVGVVCITAGPRVSMTVVSMTPSASLFQGREWKSKYIS
ncbi:hypothetical protein B0H11DRAFT_253408 [Mycena galericulata]|nr:hypothetical protein B0H11DRAFT_253408 [Mycena galericulata]